MSIMAAVQVDRATVDWLLSAANPPVRYLTLTRVLGRSERTRDVRDARARLGEYGPSRKILAARKRTFKRGAKLYQKYRGGFWQLILLGEYLAPRELPGVEASVEYVFEHGPGFISGSP